MKKKFLLLALPVLFLTCVSTRQITTDSEHNPRNSLDWAGSYRGMIPAADSPGVDARITLNKVGTYIVTYQYAGKDEVFSFSGYFKWNDPGDTVILDSHTLPPYYRVGENRLIQLDMEGNLVTGPLADGYILEKMVF